MILTVDVEYDWGYRSTESLGFLPKLFDFLESTDSSATLFVLGEVAEKLSETGVPKTVEIASHSLHHSNLRSLATEQLRQEIIQSKKVLEKQFRTKVRGFRAPYFIAPDSLWSELSSAGYTYSSSLVSGFFPGRYNNRIPEKPFKKDGIFEVPVQSFRLVGLPFGLSFMRLFFPVSKILAPKTPGMFYFHPTELLDRPPGPAEPFLIRLLYRRNRGKKAEKILFDFLQEHSPTQSVRQALSL